MNHKILEATQSPPIIFQGGEVGHFCGIPPSSLKLGLVVGGSECILVSFVYNDLNTLLSYARTYI